MRSRKWLCEADDDEDDTKEEAEIKSEKKAAVKIHIQRYKGFGWNEPRTALGNDYGSRAPHRQRVTVEDAAQADQIFDMLMGDEVAPRKHFIQTHARSV